jgi:hypothetical protein
MIICRQNQKCAFSKTDTLGAFLFDGKYFFFVVKNKNCFQKTIPREKVPEKKNRKNIV